MSKIKKNENHSSTLRVGPARFHFRKEILQTSWVCRATLEFNYRLGWVSNSDNTHTHTHNTHTTHTQHTHITHRTHNTHFNLGGRVVGWLGGWVGGWVVGWVG